MPVSTVKPKKQTNKREKKRKKKNHLTSISR